MVGNQWMPAFYLFADYDSANVSKFIELCECTRQLFYKNDIFLLFVSLFTKIIVFL